MSSSNNIYVSTSCVKTARIKDSVLKLVNAGFRNIELSGGTQYYDGFEKDLLLLKEKYNLNFLLHNYFPPPKEHFVLNLASLDDSIYNRSIEHYIRAVELSESLETKKFGLHAGFLMDPKVSELGKSIGLQNLYNRQESIQRFCEGFKKLQSLSTNVEIFIENNVYSDKNKNNFLANPFLLTDHSGYIELSEHIEFPLLLDVAHLKVSCNSLGLDFLSELEKLYSISKYVHLSDNDSLEDSNKTILSDSFYWEFIKKHSTVKRDFTLEIYMRLREINDAFNSLKLVI